LSNWIEEAQEQETPIKQKHTSVRWRKTGYDAHDDDELYDTA
jgi:hypothetical protein